MPKENTLLDLFYEKESNTPEKVFLRQPFGDKWKTYTWKEVGQISRKIATAIQSYNLPPKSNIGLVSKNCAEWIMTDLAIMMSGHVSVPLYATLTGKQLNEVLTIGDVELVFIGKIDEWKDMSTGIPKDMPIIKFPQYSSGAIIDKGTAWEDLLEQHKPLEGYPVPNFEDTWTIVFTSGTTGTPKGVVLSYKKLKDLLDASKESNNLKVSFDGDNKYFSFLPLNHIAERMIVENTAITYGGSISFAENLQTFTQNLVDTSPTVFFAVPRIWTKFQLGLLSKMPQKKLDRLLSIPIVSSMIKSKIKKGLGLNDARVNVSGAAPITEECKDWYKKLGINISEGYGMTENCAVCTWLPAEVSRPGSVGKANANAELKIDEATGEVLMKASFIMNGYYKNPEQTAKTVKDGWLHTGDQGYIDDEGYLFLTGRIKDTFKTAKGQFIVPAPIEFKFQGNDDIEQICLLGIGLPQPIALVSLSDIGRNKSQEAIQESLNQTLATANEQLDNYKKVSTLVLIKEPFSVENGMLTPTLKTKRSVVNDRYKHLINAWHEDANAVVVEA